MTDTLLLALGVPSEQKNALEDCLLAHPELVQGFTSSQAEGHGRDVTLVNADELVLGHGDRTRVEILAAPEQVSALLTLLRSELPRAKVFYWAVPVIEVGRW